MRDSGGGLAFATLVRRVESTGVEVPVVILVGGWMAAGLLTPRLLYETWLAEQQRYAAVGAEKEKVRNAQGRLGPTPEEAAQVRAAWAELVAEHRDETPTHCVLRHVTLVSSVPQKPSFASFLVIELARVDGYVPAGFGAEAITSNLH